MRRYRSSSSTLHSSSLRRPNARRFSSGPTVCTTRAARTRTTGAAASARLSPLSGCSVALRIGLHLHSIDRTLFTSKYAIVGTAPLPCIKVVASNASVFLSESNILVFYITRKGGPNTILVDRRIGDGGTRMSGGPTVL